MKKLNQIARCGQKLVDNMNHGAVAYIHTTTHTNQKRQAHLKPLTEVSQKKRTRAPHGSNSGQLESKKESITASIG